MNGKKAAHSLHPCCSSHTQLPVTNAQWEQEILPHTQQQQQQQLLTSAHQLPNGLAATQHEAGTAAGEAMDVFTDENGGVPLIQQSQLQQQQQQQQKGLAGTASHLPFRSVHKQQQRRQQLQQGGLSMSPMYENLRFVDSAAAVVAAAAAAATVSEMLRSV